MLFSLSAVAAVLATCAASPLRARSEYAVKETHFVPRKWARLDRAPSDYTLNLRISLKQSQFDELEKSLYQVSDPKHARYGKHLKAHEVNELVKPTNEALDAVHDWLAEHGIEATDLHYSPAKDWITIPNMPISEVEELLDTEYSTYLYEDGSEIQRATSYSLPLYLHEHIATIQPTTSFLRPAKRVSAVKTGGEALSLAAVPAVDPQSLTTVAEACQLSLVTPQCLRVLYGTYNYTVRAAGKNKMALNDFLGELNNRSDTSIYLEKFRPEAAAAAYQFQQVSIAGGTLQQTPENATQLQQETGVEGALDVETMLGIAWPTPLIAYSTGGLNPDYIPDLVTPTDSDEPYIVWLQYILSLPDDQIPYVVSTSYDDDEQTVSQSYAIQACNLFAQLGARGVTVLFASGDDGVGTDGECYTNDGRNASTFLPEFPSTCPYVTSVGGTSGFNPEVAVDDERFSTPFTAGGGFSNIFPRPAYQDAAVIPYLEANNYFPQYAGLFNPVGRAVPDVAAQSQNFSTVWNATVRPTDGTSASTPTFAGVVALINDALISHGKAPLGFMNPWLYGGGYKVFNDVVSGSSAGCDTPGFPAAPGWDAVTGYGTPNFWPILANLGVDGEPAGGWGDW